MADLGPARLASSDVRRLLGDGRAAGGVGVMLVFIAAILVAAAAAAVMIDSSGRLMQQTYATSQDSIEQVSTNMIVKGVYGHRHTSGATVIRDLNVTVALAPGGHDVDLSQVIVHLSDGQAATDLSYDAASAKAGNYVAQEVRDSDGSYSTADPVMTSHDMVNIQINLTHQNMPLAASTSVTLILLPESGATVPAGFTTPETYETSRIVILR